MSVLIDILALLILLVSSAVAVEPTTTLLVYRAGNEADTALAKLYADARGIPVANLVPLKITTPYNYYYVGEKPKVFSEIISPLRQKVSGSKIDTLVLVGSIPHLYYDGESSYSLDDYLRLLPTVTESGRSNPSNPFYDKPLVRTKVTDPYAVGRIRTAKQFQSSMKREQLGVSDTVAVVDKLYLCPNAQGVRVPCTIDWLSQNTNSSSGDALYDDKLAFYSVKAFRDKGMKVLYENGSDQKEIGEAGAKWEDGTDANSAANVLFYAGWYNFLQYKGAFTYACGAVVCDVNSSSTFAVRAMDAGADNAVFVWSEPYLSGHPVPQTLFKHLLDGMTFVEAANASLPLLGWKSGVEGDPLYRPFGTPFVGTMPVEFPSPDPVPTEPPPSTSDIKLRVSGLPTESVDGVVYPSVGPTGLANTTNTVFDESGVSFPPCCGLAGHGFYQWKGPEVGALFPVAGEVRFTLTSRASWAMRKASSYRSVFAVQDTANHNIWSFMVVNASGKMAFTFRAGSTQNDYYYIPTGQEDSVFGIGKTINVKLAWDGSKRRLYIDEVLLSTKSYVAATHSWGFDSTLTLGGVNYSPYGVYNSSDDAISGFVIEAK